MIKLLKFGMQIKMKLLVCFIIAIKISTSFIILLYLFYIIIFFIRIMILFQITVFFDNIKGKYILIIR